MSGTPFLRSIPVVLTVLVALPAASSGGWLSIKNDSKVAVLLQEVPTNPAARRGKPVRLLPGEIYREYHAAAGEKQIQLLDAKSGLQVLFEAKVKWPAEDVTVRVRTLGTQTKLEAAPGKPEAVVTPIPKPGDSPR